MIKFIILHGFFRSPPPKNGWNPWNPSFLKVHIFYHWWTPIFFFHGEVPHFSRGDRFFQEHKSLAEQADAAASAARGTAKALGLPAHEQATERPTGADRGAEETIFLKHPMVDRFHEIININYLMVPRGFNDITGGSIPIKSHMMVTIWWVLFVIFIIPWGFEGDWRGLGILRGSWGFEWHFMGFAGIYSNDVEWCPMGIYQDCSNPLWVKYRHKGQFSPLVFGVLGATWILMVMVDVILKLWLFYIRYY